MRKRKKILTRITLCVLLVSMLILMFSLFSSAAQYDNVSMNSVPIDLYYLYGTNQSSNRNIAYWNTPDLSAQDRIVFGLMSSNSGNGGLWHLYPFVQGQQNSRDPITYYNDGFGDLSVMDPMDYKGALMASNSWETLISYKVSGGTSVPNFVIILRMKDSLLNNWSAPWKPMYVISVNFIDRDGKFADWVPNGTADVMSSFAQGIIMQNTNATNTYPFFDCGVLTRYFAQSMNNDYSGIQLNIDEYFYNHNGTPYPVQESSWGNNLYNFGGYNAHFKSFPIKYYFVNTGFEYRQSYNRGFNAGREEGYTDGYQKGVEEGEDYNAVNGLVALAQVPGALVSNMLSFDFFGVNLANFVKFIFTLIIIAFILVVFFKFLL